MATLSYREALREALIEEMERTPEMVILGEDIIPQGGSFGVTQDLADLFPGRILQTPISETAIVSLALGYALTGRPAVADIMFGDFLTCCMDEVVNQAAKVRYMTGGQAEVPLVIRSPVGIGKNTAAQHSQSLEAWFVHVPGLHVVLPATPADAKGLLKSALRGKDPVMFFESKMLYSTEGPVPDGEHLVPLGRANVCREGDDLTIIATGRMVLKALEAAESLAVEGCEADVVDPRTLSPIDWETIYSSVDKTNRVLIVEEATRQCSVGAEIAATIGEERFESLDGPIRRLAAPHAPKPFSPPLEALSVPDTSGIVKLAREMVGLE